MSLAAPVRLRSGCAAVGHPEGASSSNHTTLATAGVKPHHPKANHATTHRKKGSTRRRKARKELARAHAHVRDTRKDFHHKTARTLVRRHDRIAVEDLNVKGLASGMLARSVHDAGWAQFLGILTAKAEEAGRELIRVNPSGTTQRCSACGETVPKDLSVRVHDCPHCGLVLDRDVNAARNILRLGRSLRGAALSRDGADPRSPLLAR